MMKKFFVACLLVCCNIFRLSAQVLVLSGMVQDDATLEPVVGATISVKKSTDGIIVAYTTTDKNGKFLLKYPVQNASACVLQATCLGYEEQTFSLSDQYDFHIRLKEKSFVLKEVTVKSQKIMQKNDTTSYFVSNFATSSDRTIGDVIANMPGLDVAENGKISFNGSPITNFYIEGLDVLNGKYNIATNNIAYDNIARVEVIENHQPIKMLQGSEKGAGTALNLKLKDAAKSKWTGNVTAKTGLSAENMLWQAELFASKFAASRQNISTFKTNNRGKNIVNENKTLTIEDLLYRVAGSDIEGHLKDAPSTSMQIGENRTSLNQSFIANSSTIWKTSENSVVKSQVVYSNDKNKYHQQMATTYFLIDSVLTLATNEQSVVKDHNLQATIDATIDERTYHLSNKLGYTSNWKTYDSDISGNFDLLSKAKIQRHQIENRFKFFKKLKKNIFQIVSLNKFTSIPEKVHVFADDSPRQTINKNNFFSNTNFRFSHNLKKWSVVVDADIFGNIYAFRSGYERDTVTFDNDMYINYLGGSLQPELTYQHHVLKIDLKLPVSFYHFGGYRSADKIYAKPAVYLNWKVFPRWTLVLNGSMGTSYQGNSLYYIHPVMTDYQTMRSGFIDFNGKKSISLGGRIAYANVINMFFANLNLVFLKGFSNNALTKQVRKDMTVYAYEPGNDSSELWTVNGTVSKGIDVINGNVELKGTFQQQAMSIKQNGAPVLFDFSNYSLHLALKTKPMDYLQFSYNVEYRKNLLKSEFQKSSTTYFKQNGTLTFLPTERLFFTLSADHYCTFFSAGQRKNMLFTDIEGVFQYKKIDFFVELSNIFNAKTYSYTTYSDMSSRNLSNKIRGRELLVGLNWFF